MINTILILSMTSVSNVATKIKLLEINGFQTYRPLIYPWAFEAWQKQQQMHWLPQEVPMADDINDWKNKLTDSDRVFLTNIFRFFTQADIDVHDCYIDKYMAIFKPIEVKMMLTAFANMETIHIDGYSYLIESLSMPDTIYAEFLDFKAMRDKHNYLNNFNTDTKAGIAATLAMYGAFTEGLQLFSSFALLLNYSRYGLMKGMGQIVTWSFRDETLHTQSMIKLFRTLIEENYDLWTNELKQHIIEACRNVVKFEDAFIDICYGKNNDVIRDLKKDDVKGYIRYLADRRLNQLGLNAIFDVNSNPIQWVDEITSNVELANFFESRVTEYSKATLTDSWDEAF